MSPDAKLDEKISEFSQWLDQLRKEFQSRHSWRQPSKEALHNQVEDRLYEFLEKTVFSKNQGE